MSATGRILQATEGRVAGRLVGVLGAGFDDDGVGWARLAVIDETKHRAVLKTGDAMDLDHGARLMLNGVTRPVRGGGHAMVEVTVYEGVQEGS